MAKKYTQNGLQPRYTCIPEISNTIITFIVHEFGDLLDKIINLSNYDENPIKACVFHHFDFVRLLCKAKKTQK